MMKTSCIALVVASLGAVGCSSQGDEARVTLQPESEEIEETIAPISDPCTVKGPSECQSNAACTWLDRGVDACVSSFDILTPREGEAASAALLMLPTRSVTLEELALSPLTEAELKVAKENSADIYRSIMLERGLLTRGRVGRAVSRLGVLRHRVRRVLDEDLLLVHHVHPVRSNNPFGASTTCNVTTPST